MNFVVVMFDTLRADYLGCYGNEWVETPTLDGLARQSAVFDRAICRLLAHSSPRPLCGRGYHG